MDHEDLITRYLGPRTGGVEFNTTDCSQQGIWFLVGCGLAFCVGFGRSAAVSFSLSVVSRPVLVFFAPFGGGFAYHYCRFSLGVGFGLSRFALILIARARRFCFSLSRYLVLVDPRKNLKKIAL